MKIKFFSTGGTIDKIYFDANSEYQVGEPAFVDVLKRANIGVDYEFESILQKDSLEITDEDRMHIFNAVLQEPHERIVLTHGTDTMINTALMLMAVTGKTIVLTGSMLPAQFKGTDAEFNIGFAIAAVQTLEPGVYVAMNGCIFKPDAVRKNLEAKRFEPILRIEGRDDRT
ncbi:MAG: asparaginase domain-containing protein [Fibrobacterales bacterium]